MYLERILNVRKKVELKIPLTIPNILSLYRLVVFPWLMYLIWIESATYFSVLLIISLITDVLDGYIARKYHLQTALGARLDSIADVGTQLAAIIGMLVFKGHAFAEYLPSFYVYIGTLLFCYVLSLIKFGRFPSLHLYSWKIGGYIQGLFFFITFAFDFYAWAYLIMIFWSFLACFEHIVIQLIIKKMLENAKGLYWVLKSRR